MSKVYLTTIFLFLINLGVYFQAYKIYKKTSNDLFTAKNYTTQLKKFIPNLDCNRNINLYLTLPEIFDRKNFDAAFLAKYALSPCEINYKENGMVQIDQKGLYIMNSLHTNFTESKKKFKLLQDNSEFILFEVE
ncbi:MAG: hypothetical protein L6Q54_14790 [Leptospiraceae bacterium]|nr:hypothetical protein [Leptospiraceae bacterium]MCK6382501.1 hypothetical protein [Leptospiraceae bacterium]NUM42535.1 hypothetical protein [Leptospiraceae bacterium]